MTNRGESALTRSISNPLSSNRRTISSHIPGDSHSNPERLYVSEFLYSENVLTLRWLELFRGGVCHVDTDDIAAVWGTENITQWALGA
ncbi:MAG: hypothetical protein Hals2KO_26440 [Halioglobus sp.]